MYSLIEHICPGCGLAGTAGRALLACLLSFVLTMAFAPRVIRALISLKIGQPIRTAEEVHKLAELHGAKAGTPTMGGVLIVGATLAATLLCARMGNPFIISCLFVTAGLGLLGFRDDYLKVTKKTSDGISARKKLIVQGLVGLLGVAFLWLYPEGQPRVELHDYVTSLFIPFYGQVNLPWYVYIPFGALVVVSASNAVNLTDGLDGLASGCSVATGITYAILAALAGNWLMADGLNIPFHPAANEISVFMMAVVGACLGFLWYNCYPAKVFMGDTGSLALGGAFGMAAVCTAQEILFIVIGGVFVMEATSVVLQVGSFKLRHGKRIFAMAPIHHHFELKGWKETQVITRFWMISLLLAFLGLFLITTA
ncbi:MAG: phospho-N-acetylmuramoyl-pentapeptide-transferase [Akkermansiaceae bacterium]|nr:phospho-N-acetylmuramoyl-pentapeptide-transferase [Akkermansiaceae bacterium]